MPFGTNRQEQSKARSDVLAAVASPQPDDPGLDFADRLAKAIEDKVDASDTAAPTPATPASLAAVDGAPPQADGSSAALTPPALQAVSGVGGLDTQDDAVLANLRAIDPGLASKYRSGDDALRGLAHAQSMIGQKSQLEALGEFVQTNPWAAFQSLQSAFGPQQPAQVAAPAPPPPPAAEPPQEFDPLWIRSVIRDPQSGRWVDVPGGVDGSAEKLTKYERDFYNRQRRSLENPIENPKVKDFISQNYVTRNDFEGLRAQIQDSNDVQLASNTLSRLAPKIYADPSNPANGHSHWGNLFTQKLVEAQDLRIGLDPATGAVDYGRANRWAEQQADILHNYQYAMQMLQTAQAPQQQQQQQQQQQYAAPQQRAPAPTAAAMRQIHPGVSGGGSSVPARASDSDGLPPPGDPDRLEALFARRLQTAIDRGEVTESAFANLTR